MVTAKRSIFIFILTFLVLILPLVFVMKPLIKGYIPFWYDPARDLLLAWDNLHKPTLIGPTTGIPGVFYGPFWIWLLSFGLLFSKDPRWVLFIVLTIPYFTIFPYFLWKMSKTIFNKSIALSLWLFFILTFSSYTVQLWSPNPGPLLFLALFYFVITTDINKEKQLIGRFFLIGMIISLFLSILFSFGMVLPIIFSIYIFILFVKDISDNKRKFILIIRKWILSSIALSIGIGIVLIPYMFFEVRHGFNQTKAVIANISQGTLGSTYINNHAGLSQGESITAFIGQMAQLVHIPNVVFLILMGGCFIVIFIRLRLGKIKIEEIEWKLLLFVFASIVGLLMGYFTSKNPIWNYRFIGVEIISLFILGFIAKKLPIVEKLLLVGSLFLLLVNTVNFASMFRLRGVVYYDFSVKKHVVESIYKDAKKTQFSVAVLDPAIYTYDYDYLFRWLGPLYSFAPIQGIINKKIVYIVIPKEQLSDKVGFVEYKTPNTIFETKKEWFADGNTLIIRRERKN